MSFNTVTNKLSMFLNNRPNSFTVRNKPPVTKELVFNPSISPPLGGAAINKLGSHRDVVSMLEVSVENLLYNRGGLLNKL